jgi:hypothetical protein
MLEFNQKKQIREAITTIENLADDLAVPLVLNVQFLHFDV